MTHTCRFVSIACAAVHIPSGHGCALIAPTHLAAIGLLIAERCSEQQWRFTLEHQAIAAGESEKLLLSWASQMMPESGVVLGWQLRTAIVQPLLEAASEADPEVACTFLAGLKRLLTAPSIDLAVHHGGAGAPQLAEVAARHGIATSSMSPSDIESVWSFGERQRLRDHVRTQAIATWRLWLAELNGGGKAATAAFEAWLG